MTTRRSTKTTLLTSAVSLLLCFVMLLGTTFAWFTDTVVSANNIIKSGNLDITLEYYNLDTKEWVSVEGRDDILTGDLWEPGYTDVAYLRIKNAGSLALKYSLGVNIISESEGRNREGATFRLSDYIEFDVIENKQPSYATREDAMKDVTEPTKIREGFTSSAHLAAGSDFVYLAMVVYMPESVGNVANHDGVTKPSIDLGINVFATQDTVESDSFDKFYDKDTAVFTVEEANAMLAEHKDVTLVNYLNPSAILYVPKNYKGTLTLHNVSIASVQESAAVTTLADEENATAEVIPSKIVILGNVVVKATEDGMSAITGTHLSISGKGTLTAIGNGKGAFGIGGMTTESLSIHDVHIADVRGGFVQPLFENDLSYGKTEPEGGAAIGSAYRGAIISLTNVTIDNALGGSKAAGIGARYHTGVTINITDCTIKNVEGGNASAGIGGSRVSDDVAPADQHVIINIKNSTVNATGGQFGAGIGSGYDTHCGSNITETICTINIDASSNITAQGGKYAAGVGTGYHVAALAGNIECAVNATAGESREKYTVAQGVGFGVVDHSREVAKLATAPTITYQGNVIGVPANQANNFESLDSALKNGEDVDLGTDLAIEINQATTAPYGNKTALNHTGGTFNGNGNDVSLGGGGDNYVVMTSGGTIKNLNVTGGFRGIMIMSAKETVYLDNVHVKGSSVGYALNTGEGDGTQDLVVTNSSFYGWNSWSLMKSASFTNCTFGQGTFWGATSLYGRLSRPYVDTVFTDCDFNAEGYILDISNLNGTVDLVNCRLNGTVITAENFKTLVDLTDLDSGGASLMAKVKVNGVLVFDEANQQ